MRLTRGGPRKQLMRTDLLCAVMRRRNLNEGPALARNAGNAGRGGRARAAACEVLNGRLS
jgi:hypothetical protein